MAYDSVKDLSSGVESYKLKRGRYGAVMGGVIFTAFNPGFPVWWLTAGTRLLVEGVFPEWFLGMITVLVGHWCADLGWFLLVSLTASKSSKLLFERGWYRSLRIVLAVLLALIGGYFLWTGLI